MSCSHPLPRLSMVTQRILERERGLHKSTSQRLARAEELLAAHDLSLDNMELGE